MKSLLSALGITVSFVFLSGFTACQNDVSVGSDDAGTGSEGGSDVSLKCTTDSDCPGGGVCGFAAAKACSATGQCFPAPMHTCALLEEACGCDGTDTMVAPSECAGLPDGYLPKAVASQGACSTDGGPIPDTHCKADSDCADGGVCGFLASEACSATGECFPPAADTCGAMEPACGCDGTDIHIYPAECAGLPDAYLPAPVAHLGDCADAGDGG
jgi:hypothetical protein